MREAKGTSTCSQGPTRSGVRFSARVCVSVCVCVCVQRGKPHADTHAMATLVCRRRHAVLHTLGFGNINHHNTSKWADTPCPLGLLSGSYTKPSGLAFTLCLVICISVSSVPSIPSSSPASLTGLLVSKRNRIHASGSERERGSEGEEKEARGREHAYDFSTRYKAAREPAAPPRPHTTATMPHRASGRKHTPNCPSAATSACPAIQRRRQPCSNEAGGRQLEVREIQPLSKHRECRHSIPLKRAP